MPPEQNFDAS